MIRRNVALLLLLSAPLQLVAQRYGRSDSAQNYGRVKDRQLLLQVRVHKKRSYFRGSGLGKMQRVQMTLTDSSTGVGHTYEGVSLETLLPPGILDSQSAIVEVSFASHETMRLPSMPHS
jgi:hypothetical protein